MGREFSGDVQGYGDMQGYMGSWAFRWEVAMRVLYTRPTRGSYGENFELVRAREGACWGNYPPENPLDIKMIQGYLEIV